MRPVCCGLDETGLDKVLEGEMAEATWNSFTGPYNVFS
jgi:hypothetical protein